MRRRLSRSDLAVVTDVRRSLRDLLVHWTAEGRRDHADTAELLTSELVTNALVHTKEGAEVTATVAASRLRVEVKDFTTRHPRIRVPHADDGTHGRGLVLVQALADAWGVHVHPAGKVVWFELDVDGGSL
ncbi:ATP-binding protein [Streptomyces sp. NPDC006879]|uniref:ATP-binding protein n=1 Tax=Streptomyces sp. NPDC006879 TaxID=3364767 RepID=UPI0036C5C7E8